MGTITSIGYQGTVTEVQWAKLAPMLGNSYTVLEEDAFNATVAAGDRNVAIAAGTAEGMGVLDTHVAPAVTISLPSVGSGSRYDMIVLRRDWATRTTSLAYIQGTSTRTLPSRNNNPGVLDDQPLWLVRLQAGQTAPQELIDLRVWNRNGGAVAKDLLARSYMQGMGSKVRIGTDVWQIVFDAATGRGVWKAVADPLFPSENDINVWATATPMVGGKVPTPGGHLIQYSSTTGTTDAQGYIRVHFPQPFPGGLGTFQAMNGDGVVGGITFEIGGSPWPSTFQSKEYVVLRVWKNEANAPLAGKLIRINWFAIGW